MKKLLLLGLVTMMMLAAGCAKIDINVGEDDDDYDDSRRPADDTPVLVIRD